MANQIGQKRFELERKIDSWYPIVKLGLIWYFNDYIGLSYELNYSWALSESDVVSTGFGWGSFRIACENLIRFLQIRVTLSSLRENPQDLRTQ